MRCSKRDDETLWVRLSAIGVMVFTTAYVKSARDKTLTAPLWNLSRLSQVTARWLQ